MTKDVWEQHRSGHDSGMPKNYVCDVCGNCFVSKGQLSQHRIRHNTDKYPCRYCGKSFAKKYHLHVHLRQHTGYMPHECMLCGEAFSQISNFNTHVKRRHPDLADQAKTIRIYHGVDKDDKWVGENGSTGHVDADSRGSGFPVECGIDLRQVGWDMQQNPVVDVIETRIAASNIL